MNQMGHNLPVLTGVDTSGLDEKLRQLIPGYMTMGTTGLGDMMDMGKPRNTLAMGGGGAAAEGPFGTIFMGGMFTILKIRERQGTEDPAWYRYPAGTVASPIGQPHALASPSPGHSHALPAQVSRLAAAAASGPLPAIKANACGAPPVRK